MTNRGFLRQRLHMATLAFLVWIVGSFAAIAQDAPDYEAWDGLAGRAEMAIQNGRASTSAFEDLRVQVADWRQRFLAAQDVNQTRIETLESQIAALGTPEEGEEEAPEIQQRRDELDAQLATLKAPVLKAEEAHSRAAGIVSEIDAIVRDRQTDELLEGGPSPINPVNWAPAFEEATKSFHSIWNEIKSGFASDAQKRTLQSDLPEILLVLVIGLLLVLRGRLWGQKSADFLGGSIRRGGPVWRFIASWAQILLPFIGLVAIVAAVDLSGILGLRGALLLNNVPLYGLFLLTVWWLAEQLVPRGEQEPVLPLEEEGHARARWTFVTMSVVIIVTHAMTVLARYDGYSDVTRSVMGFPLLLAMAVLIHRLGAVLRRHTIVPDQEEEDANGLYRTRMARLLGRLAQMVAFAGPVIAAVGYGTAAARLMFASGATLILFAFVLVAQHFVRQVYLFLLGRNDDDDGLIPVLIGFVMTLASLPVLALLWGARVADLSELWATFQEGFAIGNSRISPMDFITFVIIFVIGYMATRLLQGAMRNSILPRTKIDAGGRNAIVSGIGYVGIFLAALIAISAAGIDLSSLAIVAGALSVGIGFGLQNIVSNFVSGIILLIERPIAEGDWIEVGGKMGYVRGISVRSTRIETFDRTDVIVPNADLVSGMVTNWTRGKTVGRVIVPVGVAYGNDTRKVEDILMGIAREHPMVLLNPAPSVVFQGFGADSLDFEIRAILRDVNYVLSVKSDMNHEIAKRFAEKDIEIPFAQRDIWIRNPEALAQSKGDVSASKQPEDLDGEGGE